MATKTNKKKPVKKGSTKSKTTKRKKSNNTKIDSNSKIIIAVCSLIVLFLIIAAAVLIKSGLGKTPNEMQFSILKVEDTVAEGIDVSSHNGKINWKKASKELDFAFIRVGYSGYAKGEHHVDKMAKRNMKEAAKYDIPIGVYYYSQAITEKEAVSEAKLAIKQIKGYNVELPVFIDFEFAESGGSACGRLHSAGLTKAQKTNIINAFCKTVKSAGYTPGVYANSYFYKSLLKPDKIDKDAIIWVADYTGEVTYSGHYDIWQYSSKGKWPGIKSDDVDLNHWYSQTKIKE